MMFTWARAEIRWLWVWAISVAPADGTPPFLSHLIKHLEMQVI